MERGEGREGGGRRGEGGNEREGMRGREGEGGVEERGRRGEEGNREKRRER